MVLEKNMRQLSHPAEITLIILCCVSHTQNLINNNHLGLFAFHNTDIPLRFEFYPYLR